MGGMLESIAVLLLALSPAPVVGDDDLRAAAASLRAQDVLADIKVLASDAFEGRGPATDGEEKTVAYLIDRFKAMGLKPGNPNGHFVQDVPLVGFQATSTSGAIRAGSTEIDLKTQDDWVAVSRRFSAREVKVEGSDVVFVGYGVVAPEYGWDDYKDVDVRGKKIVMLINDPAVPDPANTDQLDPAVFKGRAMTYYGRWTYKYEEAARQGAAGMLIIHETAPASYGWATVANSNTNTQFDVVRDHPATVHTPVEAWIQRDVAVDLFKAAGLDFEALKKQAQTREFKPVVLKGETFSANYKIDSKVITSHNIVGRIEGSKRPDETVIYSAHWDHLGVGAPDATGDKIYNGAVDNATGTAALIELARAFASQPKPERSVVFLNVTAEEKGLLGSEYYATKPLYPLAKTVADINMDALDPHGPARNFTISGSAKLDLLDELTDTAKKSNLTYEADPKPEAGHFFRSDHFSFAKRGVPAVSFGSGNDWVDGGLAAGKAAEDEYVAKHYHQPSDEWQASWTFTGMARDLQILYTLGSDLANSDTWPNWSKDSEFRATRDATAAQRK
jgi:Zn-dependent M28 family amino/carboxypeptidase